MRRTKLVVFCFLVVLLTACYFSPWDTYQFDGRQDMLSTAQVEKLPVVVGKPLELVGVVVTERTAVENGIKEMEKMVAKVQPNTPQHHFYNEELLRLRSRLVRILRRDQS